MAWYMDKLICHKMKNKIQGYRIRIRKEFLN